MYMTIKEIVDAANKSQNPIYELAIAQEIEQTKTSYEEVWSKMERNLATMENAINKSIEGDGVFSPTGLTGGDAVKIKNYRENRKTLSGDLMVLGIQSAIGVNEVNAALGAICATPTAGASGTIPGVLYSMKDTLQLTHEDMIHFLFTSALFGTIVANNACISGAYGGCQAEVGSASAMAAAAADIALAGVNNIINADEVIEAMYRVGRQMPRELRETGLGGIAATPTGIAIKNKIFGEKQSN
ncbi:L-serine ammonia-lyase, iron-sulfur-dependent, subunit alpha [Bacillus mycoides]|uniref:L-serine ammonia-lyase, iron-sulfur-dependent, subunit alpha n=1 Tax=Bacillus mycoides TaxID=1405 RepID=UPI00366DDACB